MKLSVPAVLLMVLNPTVAVHIPDGSGSQLDQFYILGHVVSDAAPFWFEYVLAARAEGNQTLIQCIRIAQRNELCEGITVKAAETRLDSTPQQLLGFAKVCSLEPYRVAQAIRAAQFKTYELTDTVGFDIVVTCGGRERNFSLPLEESVDMKKLQKRNPDVARLWLLFGKVRESAFGGHFSLNDAPTAQNAKYRELGDSLVPVLRSGLYGRRLADILLDYREGLSESLRPPELLGFEQLHFVKYVAPEYPRLAMRARVQGIVRLEIVVDRDSGKAKTSRVLSGHRLLNDSAVSAASQWEFDLKLSKVEEPFEVHLRYQLRCE